MKDKSESVDVTTIAIVGIAILVGGILFFSGRLQSHYGSLRSNEAVTRAFEHYELNPDLVYYTSGPDAHPRTLMGINRNLVLADGLWKRKDFTPETFRGTIRDMQTEALASLEPLHGFDILDHRQHPIGIWYSALDVRTTIQMLNENQIQIDTPPLRPETP